MLQHQCRPSYYNNFAVSSTETASFQRNGNVQRTLSCRMYVCVNEIVSHQVCACTSAHSYSVKHDLVGEGANV